MGSTVLPQTDALEALPEPGNPARSHWTQLSAEYWTFSLAALFFDAGFAVYFFLFNLYLLDLHTPERTIGFINGAFTLGSTLATLPAGALAHLRGVRFVLTTCFVAAPVLCALRLFTTGISAQIALAVLAGAVMCLWGVGYLPAIANLTSLKTRSTGYSLIFSASIVTSALGAFASSHLPGYLAARGHAMPPAEIKRIILFMACVLAAIGVFPVLRMRKIRSDEVRGNWIATLRTFRPSPFLTRYLPCMALWSGVVAAFTAFGTVYLVRARHISFETVGSLFALSQCLQLLLGVCTPAVLRFFGVLRGASVIQGSAVVCIAVLGISRGAGVTLTAFVVVSALIWMCSPALYTLLMSETDESQRSAAASMTLFSGAVMSTISTSLAGVSFQTFGYPNTLLLLALLGMLVTVAMYWILRPVVRELP